MHRGEGAARATRCSRRDTCRAEVALRALRVGLFGAAPPLIRVGLATVRCLCFHGTPPVPFLPLFRFHFPPLAAA